METNEIRQCIQKQRHYFETGATLPIEKRIETLKKLKKVIEANKEKILEALKLDLGKSSTESYMCEVGLALSEISYMIRHTRKFAREKRVRTPLAQYVSRSFVKPSPYGVVLIMSPWNYPFLLTIDPLVDAIAAGNTVILKPSAYSPHTSTILERLIQEFFEPELITCISGGRKENQALLEQKFDYIFFTGSKSVGKIVMEKASRYLTPITLELGGKCALPRKSARCLCQSFAKRNSKTIHRRSFASKSKLWKDHQRKTFPSPLRFDGSRKSDLWRQCRSFFPAN